MSLLSPHIDRMSGYVYGEQPDDPAVVKLNTNENPFPPSPRVQEALNDFVVTDLHRYPDATARELRETIADVFELTPAHVLVTNGGDEGIRLLATACLEPGSLMAVSNPGYSLYPVLASIQNAECVSINLDAHYQLPSDAAQACERRLVKLACIPNPNAPSGVLTGYAALDEFASSYSGLLLIDEAYVDFVNPEFSHSLIPLLKAHRHVVLLRTLSKGYSLAGLRLGYLLGDPDLITALSTKIRDSYNVSTLTQRLAIAALRDRRYAEKNWKTIRRERQRVSEELRTMGYVVPDSEANFVLVEHPHGEGMQATFEDLRAGNVLVRYFDSAGMQDKLRVTIGEPWQNNQLLAIWRSLRR